MDSIKLIKVSKPNIHLIAHYFSLAKGSGTAAELAEQLGITTPTMSRIMNGKIAGPLPADLIIRFADIYAKEIGVSKDTIYEANGMCVDNEDNHKKRAIYRRERGEQICWLLVSEIGFRNGLSGKIKREQILGDGCCKLRVDITIETGNLESNDKSQNNWAFEIERDDFDSINNQNDFQYTWRSRRMIQKIGMYYLASLQKNNDDFYHAFPDKISFVYSNKKCFEHVKEKIKDTISPLNVSIVLVDIDQKKVIDECPLKNIEGNEYDKFFYELDTTNENDEFEEDFDMDLMFGEMEEY